LIRDGGGFIRLTGFVRTKLIGPKTTRDWLTIFEESGSLRPNHKRVLDLKAP
jgi:hypothetical protein